jgi:alpha-mannosidase
MFLLIALLLSASVLAQTAPLKPPPDPYQPILDRLLSFTALDLPEWRFHADVPHPEDAALDDSAWQVMKVSDTWDSGSLVFRRWVVIPEKVGGLDVNGSRVALDFQIASGDFIAVSIFSNGALVFRGDEDNQQPIEITENAQPGQKFLIAVRVDANRIKTRLRRAQLLITPRAGRMDPAVLRAEIMAVRPVIAAFPDGKAEREQILDGAIHAIDFAGLDRGDQQAFDHSLRQAQARLQALNPWLKKFTIRTTGNSHIDMAWLWPWTETVEVVRNTFRSALDLMREYPDFTFTMASAQTYAWMEEKYPELFQEIQQRVKEGRWEIVGGMWVEPDLNLPTGESLTRQLLVGKRYFLQKFGVDVKIGWNPDSFGYSWQLPQIYKHAGLDYFVTQKIYWNDTTKFPHKLFWWESPDGSRILTYFPHDYANRIDPVRMSNDLAMYAPAMHTDEMMFLYGIGDHGGGPTRAMVDQAHDWQAADRVFPTIVFGTAQSYFDDLLRRSGEWSVPTWRDELYFEYHRGVQTTQSETKRRIREGEEALLNAEKFSSIANIVSGTGSHSSPGEPVCCQAWAGYPQPVLNEAWKKVLFDQFHDIMPGSGIAVNYLDAQRNLEEARRSAREATDAALMEIQSRVNTQGAGAPVIVFNPMSWTRTDTALVDVQLPAPAGSVVVRDAGGGRVLAQVLDRDPATNRFKLLFIARDVPALGYKTFFVQAAAAANAPPTSTLNASAGSLENEFLSLTIDSGTGCITSLFDKRSHTEAIGQPVPPRDSPGYEASMMTACGNMLQTFVDKPKNWDAWNIDADFEKQHWDLRADEVKLVENTPVRAVIRVKTHFQNSQFVQDITLYPGIPRVDVNMHADWREKHVLLKVAFPLSAQNDNATYEIPFGSIQRPTTRRTPEEQAQFEVPAQRWADLSDATHGFSLLNASKYGYDTKGNVVRLSLLRSPIWPDPHADEGTHDFAYSLYPHGGDWRQALTVRRGYEVNYPLIALAASSHGGTLPPARSFFAAGAANVVITAVKKAEDDDGVIVRFYEWAGKAGDVRLTLPRPASSAAQTNLMEKPEGELRVTGNEVLVPVKPYEIKTMKLTFAPHAR